MKTFLKLSKSNFNFKVKSTYPIHVKVQQILWLFYWSVEQCEVDLKTFLTFYIKTNSVKNTSEVQKRSISQKLYIVYF